MAKRYNTPQTNPANGIRKNTIKKAGEQESHCRFGTHVGFGPMTGGDYVIGNNLRLGNMFQSNGSFSISP